ncbi:hypothetical protein N7532_009032 [Penicillium argentinense]|uniref:Uncharacterized protein n=1 Tax=Penicillium argentinense TaxID=1131581 RepID=A0A9W9EYH9_9EURO|nr:uncharacterized protein N7532_009032 [Penicillium argentinense]KAJ5090348.1 hypothetical protein N7532_009032 [Penicillium argentinense]
MDFTNCRSMELLRYLGLADDYRAQPGAVPQTEGFDTQFVPQMNLNGRFLNKWVLTGHTHADSIEDVAKSDDALVKEIRSAIKDITFVSDEVEDADGTLIKDAISKLQSRGFVAVGAGIGAAITIGIEQKRLLDDSAFSIHNVPVNIPKISSPGKDSGGGGGGDDDDDGGDGDKDECPSDAPTGKDAPLCDDCDGKDSTRTTDKASSDLNCGASYGYNIFRSRVLPEDESKLAEVSTQKYVADDSHPSEIAVPRGELVKYAKEWCSEAHESGAWEWGLTLEDTYTSSDGTATVSIRGGAPRIFKREVNPHDPLDEKSCLKNLKVLIDDCDVDTTDRKRGGELTTNDNSWWHIFMKRMTVPTLKYCNSVYASTTMTPVSRDFTFHQVKTLCNHDYDKTTYKNSPQWYRVSGIFGGSIELDLKYADDQSNCRQTRNTDSFWPDDCEATLMKAIDDCDTDTTSKKYGGVLLFNADDGCWEGSVGFPLLDDENKMGDYNY